MKKLIFTLCAILALCVSSCKYDDSDLWDSVNKLDKRVKTLEEMCKEMNTNITSLQTLVYALQENDYVTSVTEVTEGDITIGYTINFTKSPSITIYHGKDGQNGINGTDGKDGQDGKDGYTPSISIKQDTDGHYYWTLDGKWLLDNNGHKVLAEGLPGKDGQDGVNGTDGKDGQDGINGSDGKDGADGKDGITPQFKIENGDWYISLDNGVTWQYLGRATGAEGKDGVNGADGKDGVNGTDGKDGKDGDSVFCGIDTSNPDYVVFTLADGTQIKLPTWYAFEGLKRRCDEMNSNIESLRAIVQAMESNDYIVSVTPIEKDGVNIGYSIDFAKSGSINLYNGSDGKDGQNGTNGSNGQDGINGSDGKDGVDGHTPVIGVKADNNGVLYWTVDGEWLKDEKGNQVPVTGAPGKDGADGQDGQNGQNGADGKDGITPQFKIEEGGWYVSTDNGKTWQYLGVAKGENGSDGKDGQNGTDGKDGQDGKDGKDGDSLFSDVDTSNDDYVIFTLSNGTQIKLPTWFAFEQLQKLCNEINANIKSLQAIVNAMQLGDYIVSCTPLVEDGKQIGYTITFSQSGSIVIYHGKDGKDGQNGSNGQDGTNGSDGKDGQDGHTPVIGAKTDVDGVRYWTIDEEWLKDENGHKIPVTGANGSNGSNGMDGKDGITPQLKIEDGYWYISYNNGSSWTQLGKATGENGKDGQNGSNGADGKDGVDGKDGDSIFSEISQDDNYVYLTLAASGETISISKNKPFAITFSSDEFTVQPGKTYTLKYTITGGDAKTNIQLYEKNGLKAEINKTGATTGTIEVTTPLSMAPKSVHELIVLVNNGYDRTLMQTLTFVKGVARVTNYSTVANSDETMASVTLTTNLNHYTVEIPEEAKSWLSLAPASRAAMRDDVIKFSINTNDATEDRSAIVKILDEGGVEIENIHVFQHGTVSKTVNVETAGQISKLIDANERTSIQYLFVSGTLNDSDFAFIKNMINLKYLDLSEITNKILPAGKPGSYNGSFYTSPVAGFRGSFETIILPNDLISIPNYCFYGSKLKGNLIIPDGVTTIGKSAFAKSSMLTGYLVLGKSITDIGQNAFATEDDKVNALCLFSSIYCKAVMPPTIDYTIGGSSPFSSNSPFGSPVLLRGSHITLFLIRGCKQNYLSTNWERLFSDIEEVDFDKVGI